MAHFYMDFSHSAPAMINIKIDYLSKKIPDIFPEDRETSHKGDETWCFRSDPPFKRPSAEWKSLSLSKGKKFSLQSQKVPEGQTVNAAYI
ncbi:hypothetical protein LAZ67_22000205 [Cordylochernes scorpioides]|uniref:Uncharacterized protein n=1 Tax=Cordylochernes scorpioides TaxID=51811 RepID=A0ABY6LS07_9ARAC|nr:hypothetical protein LAZ67_22000205 [Cordylochernes scorpioides]